MCLPRPVVIAALVVAYCVGQFLMWLEQPGIRSISKGSSDLLDKNVINERLA